MKRTHLLFSALLALLLAGPVAAQVTTVDGFFDGLPPGFNNVQGAVPLTGWVTVNTTDPNVQFSRVIIQVDGIDIGQANYGQPRTEVPNLPAGSRVGFGYILNSTRFLNEFHNVTVVAETLNNLTGERERFDVFPHRRYQFSNNATNLVPFGEIDFPNPAAELYGACDLTNPFRRYAIFEGWTLDLGVTDEDTGIGFVELLLDGTILANSRRDCAFNADAGLLSNCYGLPRLDIENQYPFAFNAPLAGFRFLVDVGFLVAATPISEGSHIMAIRVGDQSNQIQEVDTINVSFQCIENIDNEGSFGFIEQPRIGREYSGVIDIRGWALDFEGIDVGPGIDNVSGVQVYVDGVFYGSADYGLAGRPSVLERYPGYPNTRFP
ncbi:MAG: hypothetical protein AAF772_14860, partial [Acidobacteriota bacterium]